MGRIKPADKNKCVEQWGTPLSFNYAYETRKTCLIFHEVQSQISPLTSAFHTFKGTTEVKGKKNHLARQRSFCSGDTERRRPEFHVKVHKVEEQQ